LTSVAGNPNLCISCHSPGNLAAAKILADADQADPYGDDDTEIRATVFNGSGLDDATSGGTYIGTDNAFYDVQIDGTGSPDTFQWRKDGGAWTSGISITGGSQTLSDGVTVTFGATTGHTLDDLWTIHGLDDRTNLRGESHAWSVDPTRTEADAVPPSDPEMTDLISDGDGLITCSTCHDQHSNTNSPFLRISNTGSALCKQCHNARYDSSGSPYATHPAGVTIPATSDYNQSPSLDLPSGKVECLTCHSMHFTDSGGANSGAGDGWLLDLSSSSICADCHEFPAGASHLDTSTGALWRGTGTGSFTSGTSDYARVYSGVPLPRGASNGSLSQKLPSSFRGTCFNCHWPHGWQGNDMMKVESSSANLCFTCHDGDVTSTPNMWEKFNPQDPQSVTSEGGATANQVHDTNQVSCPDCHNPHFITSSNKVMNPDDTTTAWTTNYGVESTYTYLNSQGNPVNVRYDDNLGAANTNDPVNPETGQGGDPATIGPAVADQGNPHGGGDTDTATSGGDYTTGTADLTYTVTVSTGGQAGTAQITTTASTTDDCSGGNPCNPVTVNAFNSPVSVGNFGVTISFDDPNDSAGVVGAATCQGACTDTATEDGTFSGGSNDTYPVTVSQGGTPGGVLSIVEECTSDGGPVPESDPVCDSPSVASLSPATSGTFGAPATAPVTYTIEVITSGDCKGQFPGDNGVVRVTCTAGDTCGGTTTCAGSSTDVTLGGGGLTAHISTSNVNTGWVDEVWLVRVTATPSPTFTWSSTFDGSGGPTDVDAFSTDYDVGTKGVTISFADGNSNNELEVNQVWDIDVTAGVPGELNADDVWTIAVTASTACSPNCVETDYVAFCLACHDGDPPTTLPASAQTILSNLTNIGNGYDGEQHGRGQGNTLTTLSKGYKKEPWTNLTANPGEEPRKPYAALQCNYCHDAHGTDNIYHLRTSITIAGVEMTVGGVPGGSWYETDTGDPDYPRWNPTTGTKFGSNTYALPCFGGSGYDDCTAGAQQHLNWGAWCSFCHTMSAHSGQAGSEGTNCNNAHVHGGSNF
jgi:predicted CXXCH cytochrome family protein